MPEKDLSVVIPLYNEEESLEELCGWINKVCLAHQISNEVIFIDDGSTDNSWNVIQDIVKTDDSIIAIRFNRNYGKSAALDYAFQLAKGSVVITMDADLQDSPDEIPELYNLVSKEGFHLVSGWKKKRNDPLSKTIPSRFFNLVTRIFSGIKLHDFNCGLKAYQKEVVKSLSVYGEMHRYIPLLAKWNGFDKIGEKIVEHNPRKYGKTKFGMERFLYGFLDLISVTFVTRFANRPMHLFGSLGSISFLVGLVLVIKILWTKVYSVYQNIPVKREVVDQPIFFIALVAIVIGVQLFLAGFLGELIIRDRQSSHKYQVKDKIGIE